MPRPARARLALAPDDLLRDRTYRRLWLSILISSFGGQISMLALPLTAALLLHATPTQMSVVTAMEAFPFVLLSLPAGVWLDRVRKLPVYIGGETALAVALASVPVAWWLGGLTLPWLYVIAFAIGAVNTVSGSAAQIVLMQIVPRERLVEAHARNALANSTAEVAGPGAAGALIKLTGAPLAMLVDAAFLATSTLILRGLRAAEAPPHAVQRFGQALRDGLRFVAGHRLLVTMALLIGAWHMCHYAAQVVQILFATRTLGLGERAVGLAYVGLGAGTVLASAIGHRISRRLGPAPTMVVGHVVCGAGWLLGAAAPASPWGVAMFAAMLMLFGVGAVLIFINFLAIRQAVTPTPLLGRMTSTMRWLIMIPSVPGALLGGWLGEHFGLRAALVFSGSAVLLFAVLAWRQPPIRTMRALPAVDSDLAGPTRAEAAVPARPR